MMKLREEEKKYRFSKQICDLGSKLCTCAKVFLTCLNRFAVSMLWLPCGQGAWAWACAWAGQSALLAGAGFRAVREDTREDEEACEAGGAWGNTCNQIAEGLSGFV